MTGLTVPLEEREIDSLDDIASQIGTSGEALARGAIIKLIEELSDEPCEPFATEEEAAGFIEGHARRMMHDAW